jgi:hypothetical protein
MSEVCPKCGAANTPGRSTCATCGAELELALYSGMFGPPERLKSRYVVQRPVQAGRNISIYRAADTRNKNAPCLVHQVTLTTLSPYERDQVEYRFLEKAAVWQECQHPNLLRILDADVQHHRLYLVTDPIAGISLRSVIRDRQQDVPEQTLLRWAGQLCDLLDYLHNRHPRLIVGCLSPASIHVDESGQLQLIEVGLIRYKQSDLLGPARGVRGYAAPEQREGQLSPRSDIFALGMILYELMTRQDPRRRPLPPLSKYARGYSDDLVGVVAQAQRRDPEKRYRSAAEMRQALLGSVVEAEVRLPPFHLAEGLVAHTVPELAQLCTAHWDDGLLALMTDRITEWLAAGADALRAEGRQDDAELIEQSAKRTQLAREEIDHRTARPGITPAAREIVRNAAYASWLHDLGAIGIQPSLEVRPGHFDFGVIAAHIKAKTAIQVRNKGQGYLAGRVESRVPWIVIPEPEFGCRAGQTTEVPVEAFGRRLPTGDSTSAQAIRITSNGGEAWVGAAASSSPPLMSVEQRALDFGPITRGASRVRELIVRNIGGGRLNGRVTSRAPWLRVRHPAFSCPAGASAQIAVELLSAELPKGAVRIRRALAIDSDSGQVQVDVQWSWARPALELDSTGIDFGSVRRGERVERTLTLSNSGTADLQAQSRSEVPWLSVRPSRFVCAPGESLTLSVACDTTALPGGSTVEPAAVIIEANAGAQTISASVDVLAPQLVIQPEFVDLGDVHDGDQVEETIVVGNQGSMAWEGAVRSALPWLAVEPAHVRCEPGHYIPVTLMLRTEAIESGGEYAVGSAIQIEGAGAERAVGIHARLLRPELGIGRHSLDLGLIGRTDIASVPLEIVNRGTGELEWAITVQGTWIEVVPSSGTCQAGETATVKVNAYALAVGGETGQAWLTVDSNGGRVDLPASVALSSPMLVVEPLSLELHSENHTPASQVLRVSNRGVGNLEGTVASQVAWLTCRPTLFVCQTGVSVPIEVEAVLDELREGTHHAIDALQVTSNAGTEPVEVTLTLELTPRLKVSTEDLQVDESGKSAFEIENVGEGTLRVEVVPLQDWIAVNRRDWTIKAGKKARVRVTMSAVPAEATSSIELRTPDETRRLLIRSE